jgi:polysaccharide biosynthesis transport protein
MELKQLLAPLLKWWWFILLATLLAGGSSYYFASQQPPVYQARTTLMIGRALETPNPGGNEFTLSQQLAAAYAEMAMREAVREETMSALGLRRLPEYRVWAPPNSLLIEIQVVDSDPARAQSVANELANQLILRSPTAPEAADQEQLAFINEELEHLQQAIAETREEIGAKQEELRHLVSAQKISEMQTLIGGLQTKLGLLQSNYATLLANTQRGAINTLTVIERASLPRRPVGPNILYTVLISATLGLVMATTAAYALSYLDDTVKEPAEIGRISDLPLLATVPRFKVEGENGSLIALNQPRSPVSEAFRELRTAVRFSNVDKPPRKLLITSAARNEGKSVTAANLAIVLAQAGHDVLLIDGDLRQPQQHRRFNLNNQHGLTDLLLLLELRPANVAHETTGLLQGFIQGTSIVGLSVLTSGPVPPNPSEVLGSEKMKVALGALSSKFDMIIVDSPPCLVVTDAAVLSTQTDAVIVVARAGQTRHHELQKAVQRLRAVNANLVGISLNGVQRAATGYYYDTYSDENHESLSEGSGQQNGTLARAGLKRFLGKGKKQRAPVMDDT